MKQQCYCPGGGAVHGFILSRDKRTGPGRHGPFSTSPLPSPAPLFNHPPPRLQELRLGDVGALVADYRRLARAGFAAALRERPGDAADLSRMPGRFMHLRAEDLRMHEVATLLEEYRALLASQFG